MLLTMLKKGVFVNIRIKLTLLIMVGLSLFGCHAMHEVFAPRDILADSKADKELMFPKFWHNAQKKIVVQFKNSSIREANLYENELKSHIGTHRHVIVDDPMAANVILQVDLIHLGKINKELADLSLVQGYGSSITEKKSRKDFFRRSNIRQVKTNETENPETFISRWYNRMWGNTATAGTAASKSDRLGLIVDVKITYRKAYNHGIGLAEDTWYSQSARFLTMTRNAEFDNEAENTVIEKNVSTILDFL